MLCYKSKKKSIHQESLKYWHQRVSSLVFQGDFIKLLEEEQSNVTWQSIIRQVPRGVLSFAIKASTNTLATPDNLKRWNIRISSHCPLCKNTGTLQHIINICKTSLNQGRFLWRHNSVLNHLHSVINSAKPPNLDIYSDLPNKTINGGTIPPDIISTKSRVDLVLIDRSQTKLTLIELTCSYESNVEDAKSRKRNRYEDLREDLVKKRLHSEPSPHRSRLKRAHK